MNHALILLAASGLACTIAAASETDPLSNRSLVPTRKAGTLYINMATGERTLTRYLEDSNGVAIPVIDALGTASGGALFDYWMSIDGNPCWDDSRGEGFGFLADAPEDIANGLTQPVVGFDFGDMPFDSKVTGIVLSTATLATEDSDSNADGIPDTGIDTIAIFYDALSESNRTSIAPPTAVVRVESIPGQKDEDPETFESYELVLDFGDLWFELGDSDAQDLGSMLLQGAQQGKDIVGTASHGFYTDSPDALADFQYLQYYALHDSNNKVTQDSTFIMLGTPEGEISFTTYTTTITTTTTTPSGGHPSTFTTVITVTETFLTPDALPQGQGTFESFGIGMLSAGGNVGNLDWSVGGCCYWYGGIGCAGFLEQLDDSDPPNTDYNNTWYNFTPYAQNAMGFFSDNPPIDPCHTIDLNADTFLDSADISAFVQLFLTQDPLSDLNHDGFLDNGDMHTFVYLFLNCTG